jgi:hypothetical protein
MRNPIGALLLLVVLLACAPAAQTPTMSRRDTLISGVMALGPGVDRAEAMRLADLIYGPPTRSTAAGDALVPLPAPGFTPTGNSVTFANPRTCHNRAFALQRRLAAERFRTLDIHLATSPMRNMMPVDHSAVVVTRTAQPLQTGLLLDPCLGEAEMRVRPVSDDMGARWQTGTERAWDRHFGRRPWYARAPFSVTVRPGAP